MLWVGLTGINVDIDARREGVLPDTLVAVASEQMTLLFSAERHSLHAPLVVEQKKNKKKKILAREAGVPYYFFKVETT